MLRKLAFPKGRRSMAVRSPKPLRRRAKQSRSKVTVAAILEAATRVLLAKGYARATTNTIAQRAGVSIGTLYQYFDDKDDIFGQMFRRDATTLVGALKDEEIDPRRSLEATLLHTFNGLLRVLPHFPEVMRQLELAPDALLRRRITAHEKQILAAVRQLLEVYRAGLCVGDLDLAAYMIVHASEGVTVRAGVDYRVDVLAAELARMFARYLSGKT